MSAEASKSDIEIKVATSGFFTGLSKAVAATSIAIIVLFLAWILASEQAGEVLTRIQKLFNGMFGPWYLYVSTFYLLTCLGLALWPKSGKVKLGKPDDKPEFSRFSWFSMMFGAGLGVGMLTYAVGEPVFHFKDNPDVIKGLATGLTESNIRPAFKWTLLHYGLTAWGIYGIVGLVLAYFSYNRGLPLTIRSGLRPLFGQRLSGWLGHTVDITAIVATITGVGYTIALGVKQFAFGLHNISGATWIIPEGATEPVLGALFLCLAIILVASTLSAISGVGKGIKWLSNINMSLSFFLLAFFAVCGLLSGAFLFSFKHYFIAIWDYLINLPVMSVTVWDEAGSVTGANGENVSEALATWQGPWTILYWAWWIAFAPFVGLFLARVSRGRTIREFVVGAMLAPALMCLVWFALAGGSALYAELYGNAGGSIVNSDLSAQLFETINVILTKGSAGALAMSIVIVILLITYLVTSADSAILVITTIASGGKSKRRHVKHIIFWGVLLSAVVGILLAAGGLNALRAAMLIGALPFSFVVALMGVSLIKSLVVDP
ncbi:MAG: BCCT family transporter [Hyphomonadaceae bacterium]|nr:BCCT family transporter [Hyphomonadaceae bacterium]